jgi:phenylacetate-CoA ligase
MGRNRFLIGYYLKRPAVLRAYKEIEKLKNKDLYFLKEYQNKQLRKLISYAVNEIPYYRDLFASLKLSIYDIRTTEDLTKLPILTKEIIKKNPQSFIAKNFKEKVIKGSTGGSTGVPLKYLLSNEDFSRGTALLLRGFEFGGYRLGDSMSIIAGSSLVSNKQPLKTKLQDWVMNFHHYSSYGMGEKELYDYYVHLNNSKPKFLRGYASSLYILAKFIKQNDLPLKHRFQAIYSTSEKLFNNQRKVIESVFDTKVFDNYGLHDGGITAFECEFQDGMHIDFERSILEITNEQGNEQIFEKKGKILATSLFNYAMPFIRYDTGDLGVMSNKKCSCGCPRPLLKEISGRVTDYLKLNGVYIGSPVLTVLMGKIDVEFYQFIQKEKDRIQLNLIKGPTYTQKDEDFILHSLQEHVKNIYVEFNYVTNTSHISNNENKYKFIINENFK